MFHGHSQQQHDMAKKALASKTGEVKYLQQGPVGPLVYPTGEYAASVSYTRTPLSAPMVLCEGQYYVLNKEGTFKNINPKKDYAANGSKATWVLMDKVRYSFVEILMANFAKLASAVFYGQYMFSQYGVRADGSAVETEGGYKDFNYSDPMNPANGFRPNLLIDFLRGIFYGRNVEVDGGVFRNIRSPNGAFRIEDNGDIKIIGKFSTSLNGTRIELDPDTNSIRMYNQNNSIIGRHFRIKTTTGLTFCFYSRFVNNYPMLTVRIAFRFHPILGKRQPDGWIYESTVYIISQRRVINHNRACSQNSIAKFLTVMVVPQSDHRKVIDVSIPLLFHKLDFTLKSTRDMMEKVNISQAMNQCQIVTDTNYVYVELADGSQGKIKKSDLANVMNTLIGGLFPKLFSTPSAGNVKGFIIRTAISTAQYRAIRLQCSIGFNQNNMSNENFSVNIKYWENKFADSRLSKENYSSTICNYIVCYVDNDNTFSFYLNSKYPNHSGGYLMLYAISNVNGNKNQILSMEAVTSEYVIGSHSKENKITIS